MAQQATNLLRTAMRVINVRLGGFGFRRKGLPANGTASALVRHHFGEHFRRHPVLTLPVILQTLGGVVFPPLGRVFSLADETPSTLVGV